MTDDGCNHHNPTPSPPCHAALPMFAQIHTNGNLTVHNGTNGEIVAWTRVQSFNIDLTAVPALEVGCHIASLSL